MYVWPSKTMDPKCFSFLKLGKFSGLFIDAVRDLSPFAINHAFCMCSFGML